jgi:putative chitinase
MTAGWFWSANGLNALADAKDILGMTKKVNGGTIGLDHRTELYNKLTA